jgi:hypothetical protein
MTGILIWSCPIIEDAHCRQMTIEEFFPRKTARK